VCKVREEINMNREREKKKKRKSSEDTVTIHQEREEERKTNGKHEEYIIIKQTTHKLFTRILTSDAS